MKTEQKRNQRLKRWELALLLGVGFAALAGLWLNGQQQALADSVIRLHVIANSDGDEDQALKLKVRDRILEVAKALYEPGEGLEEAYKNLSSNLTLLAAEGKAVVEENGYDYEVSASLENTWFPTKRYEDFALPAGNYPALRIVIGEGEGRNWWCVVFPPLCLGSVSETVEETAMAGGFSSDQVSLITGENEGYVVKFKAMELWDQVKSWFED